MEHTENGVAITDANVVCAGNKATMDGIRTLIGEMCELFPDTPYIHIGGDEANINVWNSCPKCREYMDTNGISGVYELYSEFVGRTAKIVLDMGKTPIVWEGFPKEGIEYIPRETIVIAWETMYHMPYDLIAEGFKVINSSWKPLYVVPNPESRFNWGIPEILDWNVYNWQHWYEKSEAHLNPINVAPTEQVIGAMLCLWECTFEEEIGRGINNLSALSERTWNVKRRHGTLDFIHRARGAIHRIARLIQSV
jgi:hexosaminidase